MVTMARVQSSRFRGVVSIKIRKSLDHTKVGMERHHVAKSIDLIGNMKKMTWYQMYETVSEGTPETPAFETKEELVDYLVEHGDFSYQRSPEIFGKPSREAAKAFVDQGYAPSMVMSRGPEGLEIRSGVEVAHIAASKRDNNK